MANTAIKSLQLGEKACGLCHTQGRTLRCSRCQVVYYCSPQHQAEHRTKHKLACNKIAKSRHALEDEERELHNMPEDEWFTGDPFNTCVGHFWKVTQTRPYMRARSMFLHALMGVDSRESVQLQLDHARDMLRLNRSDNIGIRDAMPGALLQLGMDQECYDFIKWFETTGRQSDYDWGDLDNPYLDVKDADAFESVDYICHRFLDACIGAGAMLVKVRMLLDLKDLESSKATATPCGQLRSSIIAGNPDILSRHDHRAAIRSLKVQVKNLYQATHTSNTHFWGALLQPEEHLHQMPGYYSHGDITEVQSKLRYIHPVWAMTPGALEMVEDIKKGKM
ncbi:hypothetical protein AJ78_00676 [Emergomyces pasteurianus Ep9510]|uniref:MYND-type domain-containing protein n=1 Tax=Emergomyces pasteurianus Ep9510 TaxID=1447872 RepID=A0A1J9QVK4_9EURO|nr:hypothetical protein AJ78_00676 [Emergomyces pasteurianus Ep9510]